MLNISWAMKMMKIEKLKQHEKTEPERVNQLREDIKTNGLSRPVVIEDTARMILDGHHRVQALLQLGRTTVPVVSLNYFDENLLLEWRRPEYENSGKLEVLHKALHGETYEPKTTKFMYRLGNGYIAKLYEIFVLDGNGEPALNLGIIWKHD